MGIAWMAVDITMKSAQRVRSLALWKRVEARERSGARRRFMVRGRPGRAMIVRPRASIQLAVIGVIRISTRRLSRRPSGVSLLAIGRCRP